MRAYACDDANGYARFQVSFDAPIEATPENVRELTTYDSREVLIARTQGTSLPTGADVQRFPATWKTISFSRDVKLGLDHSDSIRAAAATAAPAAYVDSGHQQASLLRVRQYRPPGLKVSALVADGQR